MPVTTILLLPHPEHRERLLAPGAPICVRRAPGYDFGWITRTDMTVGYEDGAYYPLRDYQTAHLVLARDGAVVPEGVDRLARVTGWNPSDVESCVTILLTSGRRCARWAEPPGSLVLLDERGEVVGG